MDDTSSNSVKGGDKARLVAVKQEMQDDGEAIPGGLESIPEDKKKNTNGDKAKSGKGLQNSEAAEESETAEIEQPTTNTKTKTKSPKKASTRVKHKIETDSNEGPPTKKRTYRKPRQEALEAAKYVSHTNALILRGNNAKLPQDIDVKLPTISQAPNHLQEHLRGLEAAGLKLSHAVPVTIKTHVKVLSGLCHAFKGLLPWRNERNGEPMVNDFKWKLHGLNHPLHSHQVLGSAIMITIEKDPKQGSGLLLDFMGFGKTVQTLACIVSNRVPSKKGKRPTDGSATTLVVVPKSAATQWVEEVNRHTKPRLSAILWTKQSETSRDHTLRADILVVTYDQVRIMRMRQDGRQPTSLLFDVCFQRIVLDESHKIRNRKSSTFEACMDLRGNHRWALTGTPIPNGVHELWPLLTFIQHPSVKDFADFKKNYLAKKGGKKLKGGTEYEELSKLLLPISIMRTPGHQFCGLPLVSLPQDHAVTETVPLSAEEQVILEYLNDHIMDYIEMKSDGKSNYFCLFERFMRYRQFSASALLLEGPVKDGLWTLDNVKQMREEAHNAGCDQTAIIDLFERWILEPKSQHLAPTGDKKMDAVIAKTDLLLCPLCSKRPDEPMLAGCSHIWCHHCAKKWMRMCNASSDPAECPKCNRVLGEIQPHDPEGASDQDGNEKRRGDDYSGFEPADDEGSTLFQYLDKHPEEPIPQTSKLKATLDQILKWQAEASMDKIIVFQQFIGTSRLLGRLLQDHGIPFLYFVGQMNGDQRRNARAIFEEEPSVKVLMMSMKTGSESLNLTPANRVIISDMWYNASVEEQAFGRVNRIGQRKETHCVRFLAEGTIDEPMNELQQTKKQQQSAIAELEAGKGLTANTLRRLLDDQAKQEGDGDETDSEDGEDDDDDSDASDFEDPNDGDYED
ncbi:hypothetical protein SLS64_001302 [Diaporthe eres]